MVFISCLEKLMVLLRDGRTLIGYLKSVDQFANIVLQSTIERIHVGQEYGDIPRGIFIVRGENVVLLGEIVSVSRIERYFFVILLVKLTNPMQYLINEYVTGYRKRKGVAVKKGDSG